MKKKFLAILLGALMLVSMIPATGMASTEASAAIVPNGDFESPLAKRTVSQEIDNEVVGTNVEVPAADWTVRVEYTKPISGMFSAAELTDLGAPAGTQSTKAWKIERTALEGSSDVMYAHYETFTNNLENGKWYTVEYFYNIPEALTGGAKFVLSMPNAVGNTGTNYNTVSLSTTLATDGWVKKVHYFKYNSAKAAVLRVGMSGSGGGGVVYVDELEIYECDPPVMDVSVDGTFTGYAGQSMPTAMLANSSAAAGNDYDFIEEPGNESNTVLRVNGKKRKRPVIKFPVASNTFTYDDVMKISFRVKMLAEYAEDGTRKDYYSSKLFVRLGILNVNTSADYVTRSIPFDVTTENKWINVEVIVRAINPSNHQLYIEGTGNSTKIGYTYYFDDMKIEKLNESYISDLVLMGNGVSCSLLPNDTSTAWIGAWYGEAKTTIASDAVITPGMIFIPKAANETALGAVALYKIEEGRKTLVDIKLESLSKRAAADVPDEGFTRTMVGVPSENLILPKEELGVGYEVQYFLWSSNLAPLTANRTFTIVE